MEHGRRKKRESSTKRRPHEIISRQNRSRISRIGMRKITENTIKNQTAPNSEKHRPNNRHDPMHALEVARPAKPE
jgi:hypothetical protein